jgi:putative RNA 2'-phosphotransferase
MAPLQKESVAMSYILRHGALDLEMYIDTQGWMFVAALITQMKKNFPSFTQAQLEQIVREDTKGRYSFNADMSKLRALQGHSIPKVKINYEKRIPPVTLYHGTDERGFLGIQKTGIQRMKRHAVHLTDDLETASSVGMRHGSEIIIAIDTRDMVKEGIKFELSGNGVWLTQYVDIKYFKEIIRKKAK